MCRPPSGMWKSSGSTMSTRSGSTNTLLDDSTISWIVFMPDQTPAKRLIANACSPMSRMSCTLDGKNTGSPQALKMWSLWCRGAALRDVVVAGQRDHAAVLRGAGHVGVLEHVGAAVHPRALAVPDAEHAVELLRLRVQVELLRAPHRGRAELFVDARLEHDVLRL